MDENGDFNDLVEDELGCLLLAVLSRVLPALANCQLPRQVMVLKGWLMRNGFEALDNAEARKAVARRESEAAEQVARLKRSRHTHVVSKPLLRKPSVMKRPGESWRWSEALVSVPIGLWVPAAAVSWRCGTALETCAVIVDIGGNACVKKFSSFELMLELPPSLADVCCCRPWR